MGSIRIYIYIDLSRYSVHLPFHNLNLLIFSIDIIVYIRYIH